MKSISQINTKTQEGKLLMAAMALITTTARRNSQPDEVMQELDKLATSMYERDNVCGVNLEWKILEHHSDLGDVMQAADVRFIGSREECVKFIEEHKPFDFDMMKAPGLVC